MSKCNCFERVGENLNKRITDQLNANGITRQGEIDFNWQNRAWILSGGDYAPVSIQYEYEYLRLKKDDTPYARKSKDSVNVLMSYCPFCGRKYQKDDESKPEFSADRHNDIELQGCLAMTPPEGLSPAMENLWKACQRDDKWMLALSAVSKGFSDYDQYANFMTAWPEYTLIPEQELILIDEMYKGALDG